MGVALKMYIMLSQNLIIYENFRLDKYIPDR